LFYKYPDIPFETMSEDKVRRIEALAQGLPRARIAGRERRFLMLEVQGLDEPVEVDVAQSGVTVYLGGFDWVTYPTPQHILQKFPEFMPLPQQIYDEGEEF
jgi:hypothetical protein